MEIELTRVIEDFDRAMDVETLLLAKKSGKYPLYQPGKSSYFRADREVLLGRLKCVEAGYNRTQCCMEGTRKTLLHHFKAWVTNGSGQKNESNTYWIYGLPGIGKTSLAHSICARLHDADQLAGAFFCRSDDPYLSEPRSILPTLIYKLAGVSPPFRKLVAERLRNDTNLTPESMKDSLVLDLIRRLDRHPKRALAFVIDALDECGDDQSRRALLRVLTDVATHAPWLKIIITSRPEVDIQRFFDTLVQSSHLRCDLAADEMAASDLRVFARDRFDRVASIRHFQFPWPEQSLFEGVISRARGLFIIIRTVALALEQCEDPNEFLGTILKDEDRAGLSPYGLYSSILKTRISHRTAYFRRMVGVLLATAPYRALCEETIGELAGVEISDVKTWVDKLSSLLYRDETAGGVVRVRHLSISDFFISDGCPYQVNLQQANIRLGIACLTTMISKLRFNICKLEDSRLANVEVEDLPSRIDENITGSLKYSSRYWSNHLCSTPDNDDRTVWKRLEEFFTGLYPLLWIEVLSIMEMVPTGARSLRRVISWTKVSTTPASR